MTAACGQDADAPLQAGRPLLSRPLGAPYYPTLFVLALLMDLRRAVAGAIDSDAPTLLGALGRLDYLTLAEWACVIAFAARSSFSALRSSCIERAIFLAFALYAIFLVPPLSHKLTAVFCVAVAARLAFDRRLRLLGACLALLGLQHVIANPLLFAGLNDLCIAVDAFAAHLLLLSGGFENIVDDAGLRLANASIAVRIFAPCDSLAVLSPIACAYTIAILTSSRRLDADWLKGLSVLTALVFVGNWFRLSFMTLSYDQYLFWHGGRGASLIATANALLPFLMSEALSRRAGAAPVLPALQSKPIEIMRGAARFGLVNVFPGSRQRDDQREFGHDEDQRFREQRQANDSPVQERDC